MPRQEPATTPPRARCRAGRRRSRSAPWSRPAGCPSASVIVAPMPTAGAVDRGDHRLGQRVDRQRHPAAGVAHARRGTAARRGGRAGPRASGCSDSSRPKTLPSADRSMPAQNARPAPGHHDRARRRRRAASVGRHRSSSRGHREVKALSCVGPVEGQRGDAVVVDAPSRGSRSRRPVTVTRCGRPVGVHRLFGMSSVLVLVDVARTSACDRSGSQCTARSEIGTPQVRPFLPFTRVIAEAHMRGARSGRCPRRTAKESGAAMLSRQ